VFLEELELPEPDINLGAGSGTQAEQTARIMIEFEKDLAANPVDLVIVVGDVTSTMACTIVAKKMNTKVAHVEGGIRSFDMSMPEEINRIVTDSLADYFFTTTTIANENLLRAGVKKSQIFFVGNTMIDSLHHSLNKLKQPEIWDELSLEIHKYFVLTLHRPSNVDDVQKLQTLLETIDNATGGTRVIFPVHPRTRKNFNTLSSNLKSISAVEPLSYFQFVFLLQRAKGVITDSGGIQEETTVLRIPCITLRANTERPETVAEGTNELIGEDRGKVIESIGLINSGNWKKGNIPMLWDGRAAERIVAVLPRLQANKLDD
jgi:UDP-N-acetylglucosamine 2-epimerase (non-hydrolysing)